MVYLTGVYSIMYRKYVKRLLDILLSLIAIICFSPMLLILSLIGGVKMKGNPFFTQIRPGKDEKLFKLIKFRTMTNERDLKGKLLSDENRLTSYGKFLRASSLDELPELFNILKGDMSIIGPRPQLVRDMVFMTDEQRKRHTVRQGLSGLAQVSGRNAITWESKLNYDLQYIENITFLGDCKIILQTIASVFKSEGITAEDMATAEDYGDYLLRTGKITKEEYEKKQEKAKLLLQSIN